MNVAAWLDGIGLGLYADLFAENAIDDDVLGELTEEHLKELQVPLGHRLKLLKAIAKLHDVPRSAPFAAAAHNGREPASEPSAGVPATEAASAAERRHLTVMFCDLVGSTALSAGLDPEDMRDLILAYQDTVAGVVARFEGHVAKFVGDGVVAYFGWPRAHEDAAERAVRAARLIVAGVGEIQTPSSKPLAVRVGIATGLVVVGDLVGEGEAQERPVVGDTPNLAARLQGVAEPGEIVIAASTRRLIGDIFSVEDLGERVLKGIPQPTHAWKVLGEGDAEGRFEALHGKSLVPLIGREEEIDLLLRRWSLAKAGSGQVVMLTGEPGIGKSRLTQALLERLRSETKRDVRLFCSNYHANSALFPTIEHLERAAHWQPGETPEVRLRKLETFIEASGCDLAETVPLVAAMMSVPTGDRYRLPDGDTRVLKRETLAALVRLIEGFSSDRPILMIVEDAHWLDPTSIEMFNLVIERAPDLRLLLIVTFRPEFMSHWAGQAHISSITLNRLGRTEGTAIINRVAEGKTLPAELVQHILSKTDGIPLFVEELTRTVLETGLLIDAGDHYDLSEPLSAFAIPDSLQDSLMARLDRLAPARDVAQIAACIGREFDYALLAAVAEPKTAQELDSALASLAESELIFAHGVPPESTYKFKHALVQDAAYQTLLKSRRVFYHLRIARMLEMISPDIAAADPEVLAHHYTRARQPDKAIFYWMRAGQKAMAGSGNREAIDHFSKALNQIDALPASPERDHQELTILITLAVPLASAEGYASHKLEQTYTRARKLCGGMGETPDLFPVVYGMWRFYLLRANYREAHELTDQLSNLARQSDDGVFDIAANRAIGATLFYMGEIEQAKLHLQRVIDTEATPQARARLLTFDVVDPWVASHAYAGWADWLLGYPDRARRESERAIEIAQDIEHKFSIALSKSFAAWTYQFCGDRKRTAELAEEALKFSKDSAFQFWVGWTEVLLGWAASNSHEPAATSERIHRGLTHWQETNSRLGLSYFLSLLAEADEDHGQTEAALRSIEEAVEFIARTGEHWWAPEIERMHCQLLLDRSDLDNEAVVARLSEAMADARSRKARALELRLALMLARLHMQSQDFTSARAALSDVFATFTEGFDTDDLRSARSLLRETQESVLPATAANIGGRK